MNTNTETSTNSMKFTPMPMSALLKLMPIKPSESPESKNTSIEESDSSIADTVAKKLSPSKDPKSIFSSTPKVQPSSVRNFISEKKSSRRESNKENCHDQSISNWTYPNKESNSQHNSQIKPTQVNKNSDCEKQPVPTQHNEQNVQQTDSIRKKTPEKMKMPCSNLKKSATPKIKSGIRKFTPGSGRSNRKTPQKKILIENNKESVRCLFPENPLPSTELSCPLGPPAPVPATPMDKPMPASYAATPSYPHDVVKNQSKVLFKTTIIKGKKYMYIKKLGTGGSSEVYKVLEVGTSCEYAVKCVSLGSDPELARGYVNEVRLLRELQDSDRVVRLYNYEYDRENKFLRVVLEVGETDLSSFLRARAGAGLPPALVLHYWEEMLHAVRHIHDHGVIHADLKPANFLLVCGRLKLIDFGIASSIAGDATSVVRSQATGTYSYISPEALMGGAGGYGVAAGENAPIKISFRSDVWSLGCILYSMVYGRTPFGHIPNLAKLAAILDPNHRIHYPPVEHLPPSLISSLKWCLTYNARSRPSVQQLLATPHLQRAHKPLPPTLLDKIQPHVTDEELRILQSAQV